MTRPPSSRWISSCTTETRIQHVVVVLLAGLTHVDGLRTIGARCRLGRRIGLALCPRLVGQRRLGWLRDARAWRGRAWRLGGLGIQHRVDPSVEAEHVDQGLPHDLVVSAGREAAALALVGEREDEHPVVDGSNLHLLHQQHPGDPLVGLDPLDDIGPHLPDRDDVHDPRAGGCGPGSGSTTTTSGSAATGVACCSAGGDASADGAVGVGSGPAGDAAAGSARRAYGAAGLRRGCLADRAGDVDAPLDPVEAGVDPSDVVVDAGQQNAGADDLEEQAGRDGAAHLGEPGVDDVRRAGELPGAEPAGLQREALELVGGRLARCRARRRPGTASMIMQVAQPLEQVLGEAARVVAGVDDPVDRGEHRGTVVCRERVDDLVEQRLLAVAEQRGGQRDR